MASLIDIKEQTYNTLDPISEHDILSQVPDLISKSSTPKSQPFPSQSTELLLPEAVHALVSASHYAFDLMKPDGHWCGELRSNATLTAEQVFFKQTLGLDLSVDGEQYQRYLLSNQNPDGSWGIAPNYPGDVSTSAEAYLALKILGISEKSPEMCNAKDFILRVGGGIAKVRIFTRIFFAMFGLFPWDAVPQLPVELMLLPRQSPINLYTLSSWARSTVVPLLITRHHTPIYTLPNGNSAHNDFLDELWLDPKNKAVPYTRPLPDLMREDPLAFAFSVVDKALWALGKLSVWPLRTYSRRLAVDWILRRQEKAGDWAGIMPPMHAGIQALLLEGFKITDPRIQAGIAAIERFTWEDEDGKRVQSCLSPVWDTLFMIRGLSEAGAEAGISSADPRVHRAVKWIQKRQILSEGDWQIYSPALKPGGFAFEYHNTWYPDIDDTAVAILAILDQNPASVESPCITSATEWIIGMQNSDGGCGTFDKDNNNLFLNRLPFSDMNSVCDPSTADVTGRIIEAFGLLLAKHSNVPASFFLQRIRTSCHRGIAYLQKTQEQDGKWVSRLVHRMAIPALAWLKVTQNEDGGWGELPASYKDPSLAGIGPSTPSQSAWGLMGLLAFESPKNEAVRRAVAYLVRTQTEVKGKGASWPEEEYTGTGFPNFFYIGYTLYRHYFPMIALGRWVKAGRALLPQPNIVTVVRD